jgi:sigma-E factor negative regulatory protein RseB
MTRVAAAAGPGSRGIARRRWLASLAILGGGGLVGVASAATPAPTDARGWLTRLQAAATKTNFAGTFVVTTGGVATSSRIVHAWDGRHAYELVEPLDGPAHQVLRVDDVVRTVWPDRRTVLVERRPHDVSFPFLLRAGGQRMAEFYDWSRVGVERIAGREATVLLVRPRDEHRLAYRLWSDQRTGLLLRADVLGAQGEVLESSAFSQVSIGTPPAIQEVQRALSRAETYQALSSPYEATDLRREGWSLDPGVPGFQPISCVRRPAPKVVNANGAAAASAAAGRVMLQAVYSDGLSSVSVFIEPAGSEAPIPNTRGAAGALSTLTQLRDNAWRVTVVGDVPANTLERFAAGLRRLGP